MEAAESGITAGAGAGIEPRKSSERHSCQRRGGHGASEITPSHEFMIELRKKKALNVLRDYELINLPQKAPDVLIIRSWIFSQCVCESA